MTTFFISDLHLDASRPATVDALATFLDARRDAEALYILGDLFEFWIGDDDDSPLAAHVAGLLANYASSGPRLYIMHGNRDFLLGDAFMHRVGAEMLPDPSRVHADGMDLLLMHGDSLCTRDTGYQEFRKLARAPQWQAEILGKTLDERRAIATQLRKVSKDAGSRKAQDIMDVTPSEVDRVLAAEDRAILIHGHTHRPKRHDHAGGVRWVLGDWDRSGWYLRAEDGVLELIEFPICA